MSEAKTETNADAPAVASKNLKSSSASANGLPFAAMGRWPQHEPDAHPGIQATTSSAFGLRNGTSISIIRALKSATTFSQE